MEKYCVIKINHSEKYVAIICGGSKSECREKKSYFDGLKNAYEYAAKKTGEYLPKEEFKVIPEKEYDSMERIVAHGGKEIYEQMYA